MLARKAAAEGFEPRERELDAGLARSASEGAPLRRALARIAGRFVGARLWEPLGFVRAGDYARERLGLSGRELLDLARVDAALARLPRIEAAFVGGRISWTQTRLLVRVARAGDESRWLARADRASAAALAQRVRAVERDAVDLPAACADLDESGQPEEECETLRVACEARVCGKWGRARYLARRVAGEWLPAAALAECVTAEAVSALLPLEVAPEALPPLPGGTRPPRAADAPAFPRPATPRPRGTPSPFVAALCEGLEGADARELDARLRRAVSLERTRLARLGPLLLALARTGAHRALGFRSLDAYARERLGMAPRTARALLRLERACAASPALARAWRSGALLASQAQLLVSLVLTDAAAAWIDAWIQRAAQVSVRRLEDDVDHALATGRLDPAALPPLPQMPPDDAAAPGGAADPGAERPAGVQIGARPTPPAASPRAPWRWRSRVCVHAPVGVVRLLRACLATVQLRIERDARRPSSPGEALEALLDHVLDTWSEAGRRVPREHRVFARDGWRCTVPGCSSHRNLHAHHVRFRSAGGGDEPTNLTTLCAAHHQRGVHAGRIRICGAAPGALRFDLPLGSFVSGDLRQARASGSVRSRWTASPSPGCSPSAAPSSPSPTRSSSSSSIC